MRELVKKVAERLSIPFTVGGGISTVPHINQLLEAGADKVSVNTAAVRDEDLVDRAARAFGRQCIVVAIDAAQQDGSWEVFVESGTAPTGKDAIEWAQEVEDLGAGEILLTSIDEDGQQKGYDIELTSQISEAVTIPVIASGGAGGPEDMRAVLDEGRADAALAASIFHYGTYSIREVKSYLKQQGLHVRV
jgi:cyclase